jgi:D-arabinono-1,4-lactone oxidase
VRVVGAGHSWSPLGLTDGWMINLDKLDKIIEIDAITKTVTVEAGIRIRDLSQRWGALSCTCF